MTERHRSGASRLAVVAGSGLARLWEAFETAEIVSFESIGLGEPTVDGHRGEVRTCAAAGAPFDLVLGRRHFYEGAHDRVRRLVEWLVRRGTTDLVSISAAGSLRRESPTGQIVVADDVIDLQNRAPGFEAGAKARANASSFARPAAARMRIDRGLSRRIEAAGARCNVAIDRGVLACASGPPYETHAEVRWLQEAGADLVTMSAAPEIAAANRYDLRIAVVAVLTNPATGIRRAVPGHGEVLAEAARAAGALARIITELVSGQ